jgi:hypothetical protein
MGRVQMEEIVMRRRIRGCTEEGGRKGLFQQHCNQSKSNQISPWIRLDWIWIGQQQIWIELDLFA